MLSISLEYGIDISRVRGVVDNANRILEVKNVKTCAFCSSTWSLFFAYYDIITCSANINVETKFMQMRSAETYKIFILRSQL